MAEDSKPVDIDLDKATPLEAAEPVEVPAVMGATFAERAKAREAAEKRISNSDAEDKSVKRANTKKKA
jgi:muconolactone delta-isomerase